MYYAFVYPYLHYCNEVWGNAYSTNLNRLVVLQKRVIRIITKAESRAHTPPIFSELRILKFNCINKYLIGQFIFRFHRSMLPSAFDCMFILNTNVHGYETRQQLPCSNSSYQLS